MPVASKLPDVGTTIFAIMSQMAKEHNAINLSQGFPDFKVDEKLISKVAAHMKAGLNQYAPMPGAPPLLKSISGMITRRHGYAPHPENEITITSGATEALFACFQALVHTGDEVIILDPAYDSYAPAIRLAGGIPVHVPLALPGFYIDWDQVENAITHKTRAIVLNTPHNPSGAVISNEDLENLGKVAEKHDLLVISDEVYEWLIYDEKEHFSILRSEILRKRGVAIYSFGKTFHATGWKVGYAVAPEEITRELRKTHQFVTFSVNTPIQHALAEHIAEPENYEYLPDFFQAKRDLFVKKLQDSAFEVIPCHGTYFQLLSYSNISDRNDKEMAEWLTKKFKVASIPISVFYKNKEDNHMLRFCFAKNEETIEEAAEILCKI